MFGLRLYGDMGVKAEKGKPVKLEMPNIARSNVRHAIDYDRKIAYHRGLVSEGVRLCAMRNRGFWHGIQAELEKEKWETA